MADSGRLLWGFIYADWGTRPLIPKTANRVPLRNLPRFVQTLAKNRPKGVSSMLKRLEKCSENGEDRSKKIKKSNHGRVGSSQDHAASKAPLGRLSMT